MSYFDFEQYAFDRIVKDFYMGMISRADAHTALKKLRPNIEDRCEIDLEILDQRLFFHPDDMLEEEDDFDWGDENEQQYGDK